MGQEAIRRDLVLLVSDGVILGEPFYVNFHFFVGLSVWVSEVFLVADFDESGKAETQGFRKSHLACRRGQEVQKFENVYLAILVSVESPHDHLCSVESYLA